MRPRMSRIFYDGQVLRLPAQGHRTRSGTSASSRRSLRRAPTLVRQGPPAEGPVQLRELAGRPVRLAALPALLQDLHREGVGRPGQPRCRPTGPPSGSRTSSLGNAITNALLPAAQPEGDHDPHRGVPVPEVRARDDVGALPRPRRGAAAARFGCASAVVGVHAIDGVVDAVTTRSHDGADAPRSPPPR